MKKLMLFFFLAVALVFFLDGAARAGVFGNDNLELTPDQELIVRAALGEQAVLRIKVGHMPQPLPSPPASYHQAAPSTVQAPQPVYQADIRRPAPVDVRPIPSPPVQTALVPTSVKPTALATATTSTPVKPAAPVNRDPVAKAEPVPKPDKEVRKLYAMRVPIENLPAEKRMINGKLFKEGEQAWAVVEEINGVADNKNIKIMSAPPAGAEIVPFKG